MSGYEALLDEFGRRHGLDPLRPCSPGTVQIHLNETTVLTFEAFAQHLLISLHRMVWDPMRAVELLLRAANLRVARTPVQIGLRQSGRLTMALRILSPDLSCVRLEEGVATLLAFSAKFEDPYS